MNGCHKSWSQWNLSSFAALAIQASVYCRHLDPCWMVFNERRPFEFWKFHKNEVGKFILWRLSSRTNYIHDISCCTIELLKLYTKHQLIVVVRRTLADLHTYNVRMRPPAVSADEVLAWIPWHSAVIFAIGKSLFAKKNCALLCSHSSACVGKANRAFFVTCCFTEGLYHC